MGMGMTNRQRMIEEYERRLQVMRDSGPWQEKALGPAADFPHRHRWRDCDGEPLWDWECYDYRKKPKPYECWVAFRNSEPIFAYKDKPLDHAGDELVWMREHDKCTSS